MDREFFIGLGTVILSSFGMGFALAWYLFSRRPSIPVEGNDEDFVGGWCEEDGKVWCCFCDWTAQADSMEHVEALISNHLKKHGMVPTHRTDWDTGKRTDFPDCGKGG